MKKRVLNMLLAFILCFSTLPMTAFAQEADVATEQEADSAEEQEEQQGADSAEGQEEQQEAAPVTEQKEAEAAAAPGEETSSDKSTTAGEAPDTVESAVESVSDSDAGTQDTGADDEKKAAVQKVQALINALPEEVTEENAERVSEQLEAIDEAMAELTEEQRATLDMTRLHAISEALNTPMMVAEGEHIHPVCGAICTDENGHSNVTWTATSTLNSDMDAGNYYLTADVTLDETWRPKSGTALDLNGHSITVDADGDAIIVSNGYSFTLTDCNSSGGVHYFTKNTEKNNLWEPVETGGTITVTGGVITHSSGKNGSGIVMQAGTNNGTFTMYGGTICGNYSTVAGAGVRATYGKIIMSGGAISGNVAAKNSSGGGVYLNGNGGSFDMSGDAKITENATNKFGGGVNVTGVAGGKASFTMSGNAQITGNMCFGSACGGAGLYATNGELTMNDNATISDNHSLQDRGYGGGVFVSIGATFTMNDNATISRNSAYIESTSDYRKNYGGGVLVLGGTFNMNGGSISDNMAENGAGVYVGDNSSSTGTFTMNGGTITSNKVIKGNGGGVYVLSGFEIAKDAQVLNNSRQDTSGQDTSDNVYLTTGKTFQINGKLTGGVHSIGVSAVDTPAEGSPVTIATAATGYTLTEEDADCFTSDADGIYPVLANNEMQLSTTAPHRHCVCGKEHHDVGNHTTDSQVTFTKLWMDNGKLKIGDTELTTKVTIDNGYFDQGQKVTCYELPAGNYYLGNSITLDYPIYIASNLILSGASVPMSNDVKLCLNGHTITANRDFSAIVCSSALSKTTFTLTDCQQKAGTITHTAGKTGSGVLLYSLGINSNGNGTRFNMYGGSLTHNTAELGGGVNIVANGDGGIFNLYGGVISDNEANDAGGGVYMNGRNSTFTMYAGKITSNTAGKDGGGVSSASAKFIMNGGSITGNTAVTGGGVSVGCYSSTDFTMNGGKIKNNMASDNGGGIYMGGRLRSYTFTLNGTPDISGNTKAGVANNVYLSNGAVITVGNLGADVQIPVTLEKMPTEGFYVKFAKAGAGFGLNDNIARQFIIENGGSDKCDKWIIDNEPDELWLYVKEDDLHQHAICGEPCNHEPNHSKVLWTPLTYNADTQQLMYGSLPVPSAIKEISAADGQGNPTKAYCTTYKLPAGNYYLADTIEMKGGSVPYNGNTVTSKGGVIEIETDVNLCLNGKWLVTSAPHVGVIVIKKAGALTLSDCGTGGRISSSCNAFAGVQIDNDTSQAGTFTMYDGTIMNTATGVLMGSNSIFNMYGGTIANNETGVSVVSTSKLTVGDSAYIANNKKNVFLHDKAMITIDSSLTYNARIGVTTETDPTDGKPIQIANGAIGWVTYTDIFKPDGIDKGYVVTENDGKLYLNSHIHNWIYDRSATQQTITATCNVTGCPKPDGGWVIIDKPEHEVYGDGKSAEATLKAFHWQPDAVTVSNIKYEQPGKILSGAPTDAGTYWASITIGDKTAGVQYTINSKKVTDPTIEVADAGTYDGTEKKPSVVVKDGEKVIPDSEYSVSYADNSNAGIATVTITDVAGGNYDVSGSTTFTINKGAYNGTVEKKVTIIKKRSTAQTGTLTAADFFPEGAVPKGAVISNVNDGFNSDVMNQLTLDQDTGKISYITAANITSTTDQTCKVTISSANYQDIEATLIFHPTDKETVTIKGLTYTDKTYDGSAMEPAGTLKVSDDKVPVKELEVLYEGTSANGTNYSSSSAPKDAGAYRVTYKVADSNENYTGSVEYAFTISPKAVTTDMIGTIASQEYTGEVITPTPEVKDGSIKLTSGRDFDFSYDENTNADKNTAILIITGKGNYTGTARKTFTISPKDITGAVIELEQSELPYNGSIQTVKIQSVTVSGRTLTSGDYSIINGSDMFMSAKDSIPLMIEGKGNYTGTATTTWKIAKVDPGLDNFVVTPDFSTAQTYDGTPKAVTVQTKDVIGMGAVKVYYEGSYGTTYTRSETAPTNAGNYKVILAVAEGTNYRAKEIQAGILTIDKADLTVEDVTEFFEYTKTGAQTINIANLVPGTRSYALGTAAGDLGVLSEAISIDATTGLMKFTLSALTKGNVDNKVTVPVTITSENYEDVTVNVIIYISPEYRIIDGAGSTWTQNTDGTVVIRGNGEFNRFHAVKVDGKVIDPANYEAKEGSTIITLKAEYLKTLATGSHTFAIVWNNGIAGTNFTVAANTSGNNSGNNSNNNDSNHGSDNSGNNDSGNTAGAAANTAAASAQELDKVPATGDPFGIWLTLFAISLTGLAGMLARRKKN